MFNDIVSVHPLRFQPSTQERNSSGADTNTEAGVHPCMDFGSDVAESKKVRTTSFDLETRLKAYLRVMAMPFR